MTRSPGRHHLQIPGPTNVPERILAAIRQPVIDHRGVEFQSLVREILDGLGSVFETRAPVVIYPSSGTGAWEAALVNTLSPGDRVLMYETGHFATLWQRVAERLGLQAELIAGDWRRDADPDAIEAHLAADRDHRIKAVAVVHNETSTGVVSNIAAVRAAMDRAHHPALLMVDTISSLASMEYRHDAWGVDVTVGASQKGLMLPPGLSFNVVGDRAMAAAETAQLPRSYWSWSEMRAANENGFFPYTPATNLLFGLGEALRMLREEGWSNVLARHARHGEASRAAVAAWGLELQASDSSTYSNSLTAVRLRPEFNADTLRRLILDRFDLSLGNGLGKVAGRVFRIGHLGDFNDLMLIGTLGGVEMGLRLAGVPVRADGVAAAMAVLAGRAEGG